jgi:FkbM family methyltransferase
MKGLAQFIVATCACSAISRRKFVIRGLVFRVYRGAAILVFGRSLKAYYPAHPLHQRFFAAIRPEVTTVMGHKMYLDPVDSLLLSMRGIYEPAETKLVQSLVHPGDVVVDLGANIGYYTLQFAQLVGSAGKVIAFEPDPENFELLRRNVDANGYDVALERRAVSSVPGQLRLYKSALNRADNRIFDSHDGRPSLEIDAVRLDDYLRDLTRVDFIKMDIQGAEGLALDGMIALLERSPGVKILTEFWPQGLAACGTPPADFLDTLARLGFKLFDVNETTGRLERTNGEALVARSDLASGSHTNLLCSRETMCT